MKKKKTLSRKTWKLIAKNLIVLIVLIAVTLVGARSWFTAPQTAQATGASISLTQPEELEIAITEDSNEPDEEDWISLKKVDLNDLKYIFLAGLEFKNLTSDGQIFYLPVTTQNSGMAYVDTTQKLEDMTDIYVNKHYISFYLWMRTKSPNKEVILGSGTKIEPLTETDASGNSYIPDCNYVIGAARMSILDSSGEPLLLWIPAPNIHYDYRTDTISKNITNPANNLGRIIDESIGLKFEDGTFNHGYYTTENNRIVRKVIKSNSENEADKGGYQYVLAGNITSGPVITQNIYEDIYGKNVYYIDFVKISIWVEGEDSESCAKFVDGKFKLTLDLQFQN